MLGKNANPLLKKTEQAVIAKVPANLQAGLKKAVTVGLKIMYSDEGQNIMKDQLMKSGEYADNAAEGAVKLLGEMYKQSKSTMPMTIGVPAATMLMCEALDFIEQTGKIRIDNDVLAEATKALGSYVMQLFGISQDQLHEMAAKAKQQGGPPPAAPAAGGIIGGN